MASLSKEELEAEIKAVENVLQVHKESVKLNELGVKVNSFILEMLKKEIKRFK